ncbi:hypothetical protein [Brevibacillus brevis]|uniref:hypothetical protein n=1 Tax=Brevibacillus brevis TaxID=1393 RepID=UPI0037CAC4DE
MVDLFKINVEFAMYLQSANIVVITGKYQGQLTGNVLVDANNLTKKFVVNNIVHMNYKNPEQMKDTISLNLVPDGFEVDELVGKCLISPE